MDRQDLLIVQIAGLNLALALDAVQEVVPVPLLIRPPGSAPFIEGFFDYRGEAAAVVRLDRLLDLPEERLGVYAPLVMLRTDHIPLALRVARTLAVTSKPLDRIRPIGGDETFQACVTGQFLFEDRLVVYLLSLERLLLEKEARTVAAHRALMRRRLEQLEVQADVA